MVRQRVSKHQVGRCYITQLYFPLFCNTINPTSLLLKMVTKRFFVLLIWFGCATSQSVPFCDKGNAPSNLPDCTRLCLDNESNDGTCASNLSGFCQLSSGFSNFFTLWGDCLKTQCKNDDDKYKIMDEWKQACMAAVHEDDLMTADIGYWRSYISRPVPTSADRATSTTLTPAVFSIPQTSKEDEKTKTTTTATATSAPESESKPATLNAPSPPPAESSTSKNQPASKASAPVPSPDPNQTTPSTLETIISTTDLASPSPSPSSSTPAPTPPPPSSTPTIAGAAAGGTALLALALGTAFYLLRRRKRAQSQASTPQHWAPQGGVGRPTLPDISGVYEKEGNGLQRYANPTRAVGRGHVQQASVQQGSIHHHASTERVKLNGSPYPELNALYHELRFPHHELESPQPQTSLQQGWDGVSEVHAESRSLVNESEGGGMGRRMEGGERGRYYAGKNF
ncbi:hypothetical protein HBH56_000800 [Parastagonospora nodorum]|nr:hypothetical protein HBH56_000800 [Parastagonospora nodorum]KAH3937982.1 hypothetical protein HBH54_000810 [Parastagonospora nodorum]KAH4146101.1 hypothetical protein HBH45_011710 [Parastagonospora nodorum]KAH4164269.1 hypothetical protein HBH44_072770 [Parastagonospora nodorum]KAH4190315.1 hypothetical protein HBH42_127220 [Parastagonospora nodorum]